MSQYCNPCVINLAAAVNGALYFFVAEAGGANIPLVKDSPAAIHIFSAWAAFDYFLIMKNIYKNIDIKPKSCSAVIFSSLGVFAAMTLFVAAYFGAMSFDLPIEIAGIIGLFMHVLRSLNMFDAANRLPKNLLELKSNWSSAVKSCNFMEILRIITTLFATVFYAVCTTDSVDAATTELGKVFGKWFDFTPNPEALSIVSYVMSGLGALGIFAMVLYWTHRGIKQLSFGGKKGLGVNSKNEDPSDRYTLMALALGLPMFLSALGAASSPNGRVFGQLGEFTTIIRYICSFIYGVASVIPPLSGTLRDFAGKCRKKPHVYGELAVLVSPTGLKTVKSGLQLNDNGSIIEVPKNWHAEYYPPGSIQQP